MNVETDEQKEKASGKQQKLHNKKRLLFVFVFPAVFLAGVAGSCFTSKENLRAAADSAVLSAAFQMTQEKEYVLYIGLNDKDTYRQCIPTEDAREMVRSICTQYVDGYTMTEAEGAWVDEKGVMTQENMLLCYFHDTNDEKIRNIMDEVITKLNQNAVLLEEREACYTYYHGMNEEGSEQEGETDDQNRE